MKKAGIRTQQRKNKCLRVKANMERSGDASRVFCESGGLKPYSDSIIAFCHFIEQYIGQAIDPKVLSLVCENQAEAIRITEHDINGDTIDILLETLLTVIDRLGEKWSFASQYKRNLYGKPEENPCESDKDAAEGSKSPSD